ncbi:MAG: DUF4129 domain-containing protein [Actinomycetota bacterium]|nr:DUF4129 domain-containing protein [Actinomycetota bacterium]
MTVPRADVGRLAALGVLFAVGTLLVVLAAHVTPQGYHGHVRYVAPHSFAPRSPDTTSAPASSATPTDSLERRANGWVSAPLLLGVAAILITAVLALLTNLSPPGRWARGRRQSAPREPSAQQAAEDLARRLAQAVDAGVDELADGPVAEAIIACWLLLRDAALAAGVEPRHSDTPEEFVSRVLASAQARPAPLRELSQLYREARFSAHAMTAADRAAARAALHAVRADLSAGVRA